MELIKYDSDQRQRFPKNLVRLRKERGWTKSKLAQKLGWSYNTITSWERGERMPYQYAIEDICEVFNVTETELLGSECLPITEKVSSQPRGRYKRLRIRLGRR